MHEPVPLPCPACLAPGMDRLSHFFQCEGFIACIDAALPHACARACSLPARFMLVSEALTIERLTWLAVASATYHIARHEGVALAAVVPAALAAMRL